MARRTLPIPPSAKAQFVLDNSIACAWLFRSQATPYSDAVAKQLGAMQPLAPALLRLEYTNVLRTACKRQKMVAHQAQSAIADFDELDIWFDATSPAPRLLLTLALQYDLTSYDAAYLELALRMQVPLATQDAALGRAAEASGVGRLTIN